MIFSLDVRRARQGDCLLMHFGSKDEPGLVMIDGGPKSVYAPHLRPRLLEIRKARGLDREDTLPVDLLMVSHVDDDHIQGILDLTREMTTPHQPPLLRVLSFWHNSFDDVVNSDLGKLTAAVVAQFGPAALNGELPADASVDADLGEEVVVDSLKVLASIEQGHRLREDAEKLAFPLNPEFDGKLIFAGKKKLEVADRLWFTIAGPMKPELKKLREKHVQWLKAQANKTKKKTSAALAAYVDRSIPNLSSIVVMAEFGGKRMLLTGDARGDKILTGLELTGLLKRNGTVHVDVLKVPHHGSSNNLDADFFKRITADHYVLSGNGEHGNPEREAIEMLFNARANQPFAIHLTYPVKAIDLAREEDWKKKQAQEKERKVAGSRNEPRKDWSPAKHRLAAFFEKKKLARGQKVHVVDGNKPHVIDLLDPLGY